MAGLNKAFICGRLGKDPEVKKTDSTTILRMVLATSEKYKDKEQTTWHTVVAFGKLAELCARFLSKGSTALVEGKIQTRSYEDKKGEKKYVTEIVALSVQFMDSVPKDEPEESEDAPW
jgi:single-strand DNA-binding protein